MTPKVLLELVARHADAVVRDGYRPRGLVHGDEDAEVLPVHADLVVRERAVAELVYGVRERWRLSRARKISLCV